MASSPLLLYSAPWALYPRRVQIYLIEKGIPLSVVQKVDSKFIARRELVSEPGFPKILRGSIPQLGIPPNCRGQDDESQLSFDAPISNNGSENYTVIRQSLAIINYIEELALEGRLPGLDEQGHAALREMRGHTPMERARTTEIYALAEEVCVLFGVWAYLSTSIAGTDPSKNIPAAVLMKSLVHERLEKLEAYNADRDFAFLDEDLPASGTPYTQPQAPLQSISIGDCTLFATLQFAKNFYGRDLAMGYPKLKEFLTKFEKRKSAVVEGGYPEQFVQLAQAWYEGTY